MIDHEVKFLKTLSDDLGTDIYDDDFPHYNYIGNKVMNDIMNIEKIEVISDDTKLQGGKLNRVVVVPVNVYYKSPKLGYIDFSQILNSKGKMSSFLLFRMHPCLKIWLINHFYF